MHGNTCITDKYQLHIGTHSLPNPGRISAASPATPFYRPLTESRVYRHRAVRVDGVVVLLRFPPQSDALARQLSRHLVRVHVSVATVRARTAPLGRDDRAMRQPIQIGLVPKRHRWASGRYEHPGDRQCGEVVRLRGWDSHRVHVRGAPVVPSVGRSVGLRAGNGSDGGSDGDVSLASSNAAILHAYDPKLARIRLSNGNGLASDGGFVM